MGDNDETDLAPRDLGGKDLIEEHDEAVALSSGKRRALRKDIDENQARLEIRVLSKYVDTAVVKPTHQ